jgi:hypothetical protein
MMTHLVWYSGLFEEILGVLNQIFPKYGVPGIDEMFFVSYHLFNYLLDIG